MKTEIVMRVLMWLLFALFTLGPFYAGFTSDFNYQAFAQPDDGTAEPPRDGRGGPPEEAVAACQGLNEGEVCSFESPRGDLILGICKMTRAEVKACVPEGGPPGGPPPPKENE